MRHIQESELVDSLSLRPAGLHRMMMMIKGLFSGIADGCCNKMALENFRQSWLHVYSL